MLTITLDEGLVPDTNVLIVDEFQDLSPIQFSIFRMWHHTMDYTCIAGDPYQTIYSFMGCTPDFFNDVGATSTKILPETFRFSQLIWDFSKDILESAGYDNVPRLVTRGNSNEVFHILGNDYLSNYIPRYTENTLHLVRCNYMALKIANCLIDEAVLFTGNYGWSSNDVSIHDGLWFLNKSKSKNPIIPRSHLLSLIDIHSSKHFKDDKKKIEKEISENTNERNYSLDDIDQFAQKTFVNSIYGKFLLDYADLKMSAMRKKKILNVLERQHQVNMSNISVYLGTIHSVKGQESDNVFVWNETNKRINRACIESEIEVQNEARVWFVAATRARKNLFWVDSGKRYTFNV
jgi:DNA helicase-2/ATP-dependent DNA helicase PcrA